MTLKTLTERFAQKNNLISVAQRLLIVRDFVDLRFAYSQRKQIDRL